MAQNARFGTTGRAKVRDGDVASNWKECPGGWAREGSCSSLVRGRESVCSAHWRRTLDQNTPSGTRPCRPQLAGRPRNSLRRVSVAIGSLFSPTLQMQCSAYISMAGPAKTSLRHPLKRSIAIFHLRRGELRHSLRKTTGSRRNTLNWRLRDRRSAVAELQKGAGTILLEEFVFSLLRSCVRRGRQSFEKLDNAFRPCWSRQDRIHGHFGSFSLFRQSP
jgi:hypothetical protein